MRVKYVREQELRAALAAVPLVLACSALGRKDGRLAQARACILCSSASALGTFLPHVGVLAANLNEASKTSA